MWKHLPRFYFDLETTSKYPEQAWTIQLGTALEQGGQLRTGARSRRSTRKTLALSAGAWANCRARIRNLSRGQ